MDGRSNDEEEEDARRMPRMTKISRHTFGSTSERGFSISVVENMEEEYGMFVWPCSVVLAEYVWLHRSRFSGASVLEVGAGTCLPGLVAAKLGSEVTLTDNSTRLQVLENMRRVCDINQLNCKVMGLTWGEWDEPMFSLKPNIILGADVLYDTKDFGDLFATVTFLLERSPGSIFITTYHNRSGHHLVEYLMVKWRLKCTKLLDAFSFMPSCKATSLSGNIQLAEIMLEEPSH
ncbi:hypothetical protein Syun_005469 [Stephania yunnanensis]|uniref:Methyltransferase-like protein 23 n=1 Tax=Stephania yunnanensis TaxID=152371 RepID=A0AAP0L696_9MAGN